MAEIAAAFEGSFRDAQVGFGHISRLKSELVSVDGSPRGIWGAPVVPTVRVRFAPAPGTGILA